MNTKGLKQFIQFGVYGAIYGCVIGCLVIFIPYMYQLTASTRESNHRLWPNPTGNNSWPVTYVSPKGFPLDEPLCVIAQAQFKNGDEEAALQTIDIIASIETREYAICQIINELLSDSTSEKPTQIQVDKAIQLMKRLQDKDSKMQILISIARAQSKMDLKKKAKETFEKAKLLALEIEEDKHRLESKALENKDWNQSAKLGEKADLQRVIAEEKKSTVDPEQTSVKQTNEVGNQISMGWYIVLWPIVFSAFGFIIMGMLSPILNALGKIIGISFADSIGYDSLKKELHKK